MNASSFLKKAQKSMHIYMGLQFARGNGIYDDYKVSA
jgi:hypothetical protein